MKTIVIFFTMFSCWLLFSCGSGNADKNLTTTNSIPNAAVDVDTNVLRVYVDNLGAITADGQITTLPDLDKKMQELKNKEGIIYYSRDNAIGDPPKESMQVMDIIVKYKLPVKFFTDKTFTQVVKLK
jgi:hypothetical protein